MAIIGTTSTFRDVREWYTRLAILERQVCLIEFLDQTSLATGFLVAPDIVMTAAHVLPARYATAFDPKSIRVRFDFSQVPGGDEIEEGTSVKLSANPDHVLVAISDVQALDVALLRLAEPFGENSPKGTSHPRGWVELATASAEPKASSSLAILQHAYGGPLKLSLETKSIVVPEAPGEQSDKGKFPQIVPQPETRFFHRTDSMPGSSGAPCFDIDWGFVGLHQGRIAGNGSKISNFGVRASAISAWLKSAGVWSAVERESPSHLRFTYSGAVTKHNGSEFPAFMKQLVDDGETETVEFKEGCLVQGSGKSQIAAKIMATVAAFLNSREGGRLFLGVADDGNPVGIQNEYSVVNPQKANWDAYQLWLLQKIQSQLDSPIASPFISASRYLVEEKEICVIEVRPASAPVLLSGKLPVRNGASTESLEGHKMLAYYSDRWRSLPYDET